jgi:hypothetical protein
MIEREETRALAKIQASVQDDISRVNDAAQMGLKLPRDNLESLASDAERVGMSAQADRLRLYADVQDKAADFAVQPIKKQVADLKTIRAELEGGDLSRLEEFESLTGVYETKVKMLSSDPWSYYSAHGITRAPEMIQNLSDPEQVQAALAQRKADIAVIRNMEGFTLPILTKHEMDQIKAVATNGRPEESAGVITALSQSLDLEQQRAIAQAISTDAPIMAAAMAQDEKTARDILAGQVIKGDVPATKVREKVNEKISGMVFDPEANEGLHSAIYAVYKQRSLQAGDTSKEPDDDRVEKVIEDVIGKPVSFSLRSFGPSSDVFTFKDGGEYLSAGELKKTFKSLTDERLKAINGMLPVTSDGIEVGAEELLGKAKFVTAGDGKYIPVYEGLGVVTHQDGRPYVIDARKLRAMK